MVGLVEWCYRHAPMSVNRSDIYEVLDNTFAKALEKYLLKYTKYDIQFLKSMTLKDLSETPKYEQYVTLLGHIYSLNIIDVPMEKMKVYIKWMLNNDDFETGLIAYIWSKSSLKTIQEHVDTLSVVNKGCSRKVLSFLWDVANSGDKFLTSLIYFMCSETRAPEYIKMYTYLYVCSKCSLSELKLFFIDIEKVDEEDIEEYTDKFTRYYWSRRVLDKLMEYNYTIARLEKPIMEYADDSFIKCGREFPISQLHRKSSIVKKGKVFYVESLPEVPHSYRVNFNMWNKAYKDITPHAPVVEKSKYEIWFDNLSEEGKNKLKVLNPVVYEACVTEKYQYIAPMLDGIMKELR